MGHQQMVGVTARPLDANPARGHAMVVHALETTRALAAANPGAHQAILSNGYVFGIDTRGDDGAKGFMAKRNRRMHSALTHVEAFASSEIEITIADMHVAVADPAILQLQQHFGTGRLRRLLLGFLQRFAPLHDVITQHCVPLLFLLALYAAESYTEQCASVQTPVLRGLVGPTTKVVAWRCIVANHDDSLAACRLAATQSRRVAPYHLRVVPRRLPVRFCQDAAGVIFFLV